MNLYRTLPKQNFVDTLTKFIVNKFNILDKVKIIVPNSLIAYNLQKHIISYKQITILPEIYDYQKATSSGEEVFSIPTNEIETIAPLEENIILAEIIKNNKNLNYNNLQALKFAPLLAKLFNQLIAYNINIQELNSLPTLSQSEHWQYIYSFLQSAYLQWQEKIKNLNRTSKAQFFKNFLNTEIIRLKDSNYYTIIAGFLGEDPTCYELFKIIAEHPNGFIFLPPLPYNLDIDTTDDTLDNLYQIKQLLNLLNKTLSDFKIFNAPKYYQNSILDKIICSNIPKVRDKYINNIRSIECTDIFCEARLISNICLSNPEQQIAIILPNVTNKGYYTTFLQRYNLQFNDYLGDEIINSSICQLIINFSELVCNDFNLKNLFILLKNPLLVSPEIYVFEKILLRNNYRFLTSLQQVNEIIIANNLEIEEWWLRKSNLLIDVTEKINNLKNQNFTEILNTIINCIEKLLFLLPNQQFYFAQETGEFLTEIANIKSIININELKEFPFILRSLIKNAKKYTHLSEHTANINIGLAKDFALIKFDIVIMADFSHGSWPAEEAISPWLNKQMQKELNFYPEHINNCANIYYFYLLLHNTNIYLTRFKRHNSKLANTSNYLKILQYFLPIITQQYVVNEIKGSNDCFLGEQQSDECNTVVNEDCFGNIKQRMSSNGCGMYNSEDNHKVVNYIEQPVDNMVHPDKFKEFKHDINISFPKEISITDLEMLVRNPYSFYVKKILKLKKLNAINDVPGILEYGNYLHLLFDRYNKNYKSAKKNKLANLLTISDNLLNNDYLPEYIKYSWHIKTKALAEDFIKFDELRRKEAKIYTEISAKLPLTILGHQVTIIGRADRVELMNNGNAKIIDFKTGSIPSKKDILSGLSPQLLILGIMAIENNFGFAINSVELEYIKIENHSPYLEITSLSDVTKVDLLMHKQALIDLLSHYIKTMDFSANTNLLKYNDYGHFARKLT